MPDFVATTTGTIPLALSGRALGPAGAPQRIGRTAVLPATQGPPHVATAGIGRFIAYQTGPLQLWRDQVGPPFLYTAARWGAQSWYLEAYLRATSAKALARLYDVTAAAAVAGSVVTQDNAQDGLAALTRLRSGALTLTDGHEYRVQFGVQNGGAGAYLGAKLVAA